MRNFAVLWLHLSARALKLLGRSISNSKQSIIVVILQPHLLLKLIGMDICNSRRSGHITSGVNFIKNIFEISKKVSAAVVFDI